MYEDIHHIKCISLFMLKGYSTPNWTFSHQSLKPIKALFVFRTQFKVFLDANREACVCPIDCQVNNTVKVQKSIKHIIKIVHMPSVVQSDWYEATIIIFVCKEN